MAKSIKNTTKSSTKSPSKTTKIITKSSKKPANLKKSTNSKKPAKRIEGNLRSAFARQVIEGTYDIDQCRKDIKSFTVGMSEEWKKTAYDILDNVKSAKYPDAYFRALCNNALTNHKHNYDGIPVIRYWEK